MAKSLNIESVERMENLLYSMEALFLNVKNLSPYLPSSDQSTDGGIDEGIAWQELMEAIGCHGKHYADAALQVISDAGLLVTQRSATDDGSTS